MSAIGRGLGNRRRSRRHGRPWQRLRRRIHRRAGRSEGQRRRRIAGQPGTEGLRQRAGVERPVRRLEREATRDRRGECGVDAVHAWRSRTLRVGQRKRRRLGVRRSPGERLVEDGAQAVEVRARRDRSSRQLLGRHRVEGPDHRSDRGQPLGRGGQAVGDAEIDQARAAVRGEQDIARLHVAVDHAALMGVEERLGDVGCDRDCVCGRERTLARDARCQRLAIDQLHHERRRFPGGIHVVDLDDRRVSEAGRGARLGHEPLARCLVGQQVGMQPLHGHIASQLLVLRAPDLGAPAGGEALEKPIPTEDQRFVHARPLGGQVRPCRFRAAPQGKRSRSRSMTSADASASDGRQA